MSVGIEAINAYGGRAFLNVRTLFRARGLDLSRFDNLMMEKKAVALPCEDSVTNAVNAAKPIIDRMSAQERSRIEMVITSTESGIDFGKSLSTYVHAHLGLERRCRLFEVKQACYGGTAALQMAANYVASNVSPGSKILVVATDVARAAAKGTYVEPSQGTAGVAMLIGDAPQVLELDFGANGFYGYEVMDACRPEPHLETGDSDLSLLSYLDCLEGSYRAYEERVDGADFVKTFDYLAFHTPFAGMVKGAHRSMMRKFSRATADAIDADFQRRVAPSFKYCVEVGNVYSATVYLALCSLVDAARLDGLKRVGLYSYGSGCSSEFFSGIISPGSQDRLAPMQLAQSLATRHELSMVEYDGILDQSMDWMFGVQNREVDFSGFSEIYRNQFERKGYLVLKGISNYHREYLWS